MKDGQFGCPVNIGPIRSGRSKGHWMELRRMPLPDKKIGMGLGWMDDKKIAASNE